MDIAETPAIIALFLVANCGEDCQMSVARCMRDMLEWSIVNYACEVLQSPRISGSIYTPKWEELILDREMCGCAQTSDLTHRHRGECTYSDGANDWQTDRILSKHHFRSININGSSMEIEIQPADLCSYTIFHKITEPYCIEIVARKCLLCGFAQFHQLLVKIYIDMRREERGK